MTTSYPDIANPNSTTLQRDILVQLPRVPLQRAFSDSAVYFILFAASGYPIFNYSSCSRGSSTAMQRRSSSLASSSCKTSTTKQHQVGEQTGLPQMPQVDGEAPESLLSELTYGSQQLARQTPKNYMPLKVYLLPAFSSATTSGGGIRERGSESEVGGRTQCMQLVISTSFRYHQIYYPIDGRGEIAGGKERKIGISIVFVSFDPQKVEWCQKNANFIRSRMNCLLDPCMIVATNYWQRLIGGFSHEELLKECAEDMTLIRAGVELQIAFAHYLCPTRFIPFIDFSIGGDVGKNPQMLDPSWYSTSMVDGGSSNIASHRRSSSISSVEGATGSAANRRSVRSPTVIGSLPPQPTTLVPYIPSLVKSLQSWWSSDQSFLIKVLTGVIGLSDYHHLSDGLKSVCLPSLVDFSCLTPTQSVADFSFEDAGRTTTEKGNNGEDKNNNSNSNVEEEEEMSTTAEDQKNEEGEGEMRRGSNVPVPPPGMEGSPIRRGPPSPYAQAARRIILVSADKDRGLSLLGICAFFFRNVLHRSGAHSHGTLPLASVSHNVIAGHSVQLYPEPTLPEAEFSRLMYHAAYSSVLIVNIAQRTVIRYHFARAGLPSNVLIDLMPNNTWGNATEIVSSQTVGHMMHFLMERIGRGVGGTNPSSASTPRPTSTSMASSSSDSKRKSTGTAGLSAATSGGVDPVAKKTASTLSDSSSPVSDGKFGNPGPPSGSDPSMLYHHYYTSVFRSSRSGSEQQVPFSCSAAPFVPPPLPNQFYSLCDIYIPIEHLIADFLIFFQLQAETYRQLTGNMVIPSWDEISNSLEFEGVMTPLPQGGSGTTGLGAARNMENWVKGGKNISPIAPMPPTAMATGGSSGSSLPVSSRSGLIPQSQGSGSQSSKGQQQPFRAAQMLPSQLTSVFGKCFHLSHLQLLSLMCGGD